MIISKVRIARSLNIDPRGLQVNYPRMRPFPLRLQLLNRLGGRSMSAVRRDRMGIASGHFGSMVVHTLDLQQPECRK